MARSRSGLISMTGFGDAQTTIGNGQLSIETKTVNHRYFDFNFRAPEHLRFCEALIRERVQRVIKRGRVEVNLFWRTSAATNDTITINPEMVTSVLAAAHSVAEQAPNLDPMRVNDVLKWPGVIGSTEITNDTWRTAVEQITADALEQLVASRQKEGAAMHAFMSKRIELLHEQVTIATQRVPAVSANYRTRIEDKLAELQGELDHERVEQEMILFLNRIDVSEEIERLNTHLEAFDKAIQKGGVIGRRLDFMLQEINRESNTLGSKSPDTIMTSASVEIKVLLEQIREQVQNIE